MEVWFDCSYIYLDYASIGRILGGDSSGTLLIVTSNNYARSDMVLNNSVGYNITPIPDILGKDGENILLSELISSWWIDKAKFASEIWDLSDDRLPHLKDFTGVTQNPR